MAVFVLVFLVILLSITGLAVGILLGRAPLQGTCSASNCSKIIKCSGCTAQPDDWGNS